MFPIVAVELAPLIVVNARFVALAPVAKREVTVSFTVFISVATTVPIVAVAEPALTVVNARLVTLAPVA